MPETAEQYIARIISNLGTQDPMQVLATTPSRIGGAIAGRSDDDLRWTPAADRWSIAAIVTLAAPHLVDTGSSGLRFSRSIRTSGRRHSTTLPRMRSRA